MVVAWLAGFCALPVALSAGPRAGGRALVAHAHPHALPWGGASLPSFAAAFVLAALARARRKAGPYSRARDRTHRQPLARPLPGPAAPRRAAVRTTAPARCSGCACRRASSPAARRPTARRCCRRSSASAHRCATCRATSTATFAILLRRRRPHDAASMRWETPGRPADLPELPPRFAGRTWRRSHAREFPARDACGARTPLPHLVRRPGARARAGGRPAAARRRLRPGMLDTSGCSSSPRKRRRCSATSPRSACARSSSRTARAARRSTSVVGASTFPRARCPATRPARATHSRRRMSSRATPGFAPAGAARRATAVVASLMAAMIAIASTARGAFAVDLETRRGRAVGRAARAAAARRSSTCRASSRQRPQARRSWRSSTRSRRSLVSHDAGLDLARIRPRAARGPGGRGLRRRSRPDRLRGAEPALPLAQRRRASGARSPLELPEIDAARLLREG